MAQRLKNRLYDDNVDADPEPPIKNPKSCKTKFMKDLNYKSNAIIRSEKNNRLNSNSKQKEHILKQERARKKSDIQLVEMRSLMERMVPGAKITKGQFKDNKLNGNVEIVYDNGNVFIGKYQNGVRVEGKMSYPEMKCEYEGSFFAQKFSGFGKLSYEGGRVIEGEWDNMEFVGKATITYPNKDVYYGPVDQNLYKHGHGYLFLHNGEKYIGSFQHGSITGIGSYYKNDVLITRGHWLKGKLVKQIGIQEDSEGMEATTSLPPDFDIKAMKQSSATQFTYGFKEKDDTISSPKLDRSVPNSVDSADSFITLKQKDRLEDQN